jgi:hypothetical protein
MYLHRRKSKGANGRVLFLVNHVCRKKTKCVEGTCRLASIHCVVMLVRAFT